MKIAERHSLTHRSSHLSGRKNACRSRPRPRPHAHYDHLPSNNIYPVYQYRALFTATLDPTMDEYTIDAFVNRDEPIPVINLNVSGSDTPLTTSSDSEGKRARLKNALSGSNLKNKLQDVVGPSSSESGHSLQDRLFAK